MGVLSDQFINITFQDAEFSRPLTMIRTTSPVTSCMEVPDDTGAGWFRETPAQCRRFHAGLGEFAVDREGAGNIARVTLYSQPASINTRSPSRSSLSFRCSAECSRFHRCRQWCYRTEARTVAVKFVVNFAFQMVLELPGRHFSIARVCARAVISPAGEVRQSLPAI